MASTSRPAKSASRAKRRSTTPAKKPRTAPRATKAAAAPARPRKTAVAADGASTPMVTPRNLAMTAPTIGEGSGLPRRAIFIDVENTSSETELVRVLDELKIDRRAVPTEITAVGNWRVIGQQLGRVLAARGVNLVHSAPATRVRDWSDLWIAVSAGMWLGRASSGDSIDIISDDRAFDAVGDAASRLGIAYRRISCRGHHHVAVAAEPAHAPEPRGRTPAGGPRRRRRRGGAGRTAAVVAAEARPVSPTHDDAGDEERHAASQAQIRALIARLTGADPARGVSLDALTVALKAEGFQRPPGSPRLITRLRRLKDVEVFGNGRVRLVGDSADIATAVLAAGDQPTPAAFDGDGVSTDVVEADGDAGAADDEASPGAPASGESADPTRRRRSRRRGGRRRTRRSGTAAQG